MEMLEGITGVPDTIQPLEPDLDIQILAEVEPEVKHRDKDRRSYTLNRRQIRKLVDAVKTSNKNGVVVTGLRDSLIIQTLLETGARISEVLNLTVGDIDLLEGTVSIRESKSGRGRVLSLPTHLLSQIDNIWLPFRKETFGVGGILYPVVRTTKSNKGKAINPNGWRVSFNKYVKASGLDELSFSVTPHTLRHTFSIQFLADGGSVKDLQYILGHRNIQTTFLYLHSFDPDIVKRLKRRRPLLDPDDINTQRSPYQRFVRDEL